MTTPVQVGYRDFGRQLAQSDTIIENRVSTMTGIEISGMIPTGGMQYLTINFFGSGAAIRATIEWYADEIRSIQIGKDAVTIGASGTAEVSFPIRAPFLRFFIEGASYPCSMSLLAVMASVPFSSTGQDGEDGMLFSVFNTAIGAATTIQLTSSVTLMGEAVLSVETSQPNWQARLDAMNLAGTARFLCDVDGVTGRNPRTVFIPPLPIRATIINPGAAGAYNLGLVMRPGAAGS